jgi:hypothetical protein
MSLKLKPAGKVLIIAAVVTAGIFTVQWYQNLPKAVGKAIDTGRIELPDMPEISLKTNITKLPLPLDEAAANGGSSITWEVMAWNSQFSALYANGGIRTRKGSLFDKAHLDITYIRQDNCKQQIADLVKFANEYQNDTRTPGVLITLMGDGMPAYMTELSKALETLGPEYQPIIIPVSHGRSFGENQLMGPIAWKHDPRHALGACVAGVLRDGDMNLLLKWAGDNGLKVNPNNTTYDAQAINLIAANDFLDAAKKYIGGFTEKRKLVINGRTIGRDTIVGVDAVATRTPGDVYVATRKGGLVTIAGTKQNAAQIINQTIAIKKWAYEHRTDIENMIIALAQAGDQVRAFEDARRFAAEISAKVYKEQNGAYWLKYFNGVEEKDVQGLKVQLGGSAVFNLAGMANIFGMGDDRIDRYRAVYNSFGNLMVKMYPTEMSSFLPYEKAVDKSFLYSVIINHPELLQGKVITTENTKETAQDSSTNKKAENVPGE